MTDMSKISPSLQQIREASETLHGRIVATPVLNLSHDPIVDLLGEHVSMKLELFQHAGSFKARGNLLGMDRLDATQRAAGVIAASGGNHALAVSWAAQKLGVAATIIMPRATDPLRIEGCKAFGASVLLVDDIASAFDLMNTKAANDELTMMHPFEGEHMTLGAATCGTEILNELPDLDVMVIAVGGGGLISGISAAIKQARPTCEIIGVEPFGADSLFQSLEKGEPVRIGTVNTIADSLGSPAALPYSFAIAQKFVKRVIRIDDNAMLAAMGFMRDHLKLMVEPACAAALAAAMGPLQDEIRGKRACLLACGSNIGLERYNLLLRNQKARA